MSNASSIQEPEMFTEKQGVLVPTFGGTTYVPELDKDRLGAQLKRVRECMEDGTWRTLCEISDITEAPEASVSARLRDLRKLGRTVERERRGDPKRGIHVYRVPSENPNAAGADQVTPKPSPSSSVPVAEVKNEGQDS